MFGLYRSFYDRVVTAAVNGGAYPAGASSVETHGGGVGGGVVINLVPRHLDIQGSILTGRGIGRYGSGSLPDATAKPNGSLQGIPETMLLAGGVFHATKALDFYVFGGQEKESTKTYTLNGALYGFGVPVANNSGCEIEGGTCSPLNRAVMQITGGFWDKFYQGSFGRTQFGIQYSYTERLTFADAATHFAPTAKEDMVFFSFRYYPF